VDLLRFFRRRVGGPRPSVEGEEYEILKAERREKDERRRFHENIAEKMGHLSYPFKKDPFD